MEMNDSLVYLGDVSRLRMFIQRANAGESLTLGFIGGSITNGSLASVHANCYAARTAEWFREKYKKADFKYINAGIGGTTSHFGVARVYEDLLVHNPDFVVIEFSVNDENNLFYRETFEGLVRRIYGMKSKPAVIILHNVMYDTGTNAQDQHETVGRYYGIPCISVKSSIYQDVAHGRLPAESITPDNLHPNDLGHKMLSELLTDFIDRVASDEFTPFDCSTSVEYRNIGDTGAYDLPKPMTYNAYENVRRLYEPSEVRYISSGTSAVKCREDGGTNVSSDSVSTAYGVKSAFVGYEKGDYAFFECEGTEVAAQFIRFVKHPACVARAIVDEDEENAVILDGNFDETWGDKLDIKLLLFHGKHAVHRVKIEIIEGNRVCVPFRLVSLIC